MLLLCSILLLINVIYSQIPTTTNLVNNYLCTEDYCEKFISESGCPLLEEPCRAQNSTHNGIILPSLTTCNCCEMCLINLKEKEDCTLGLVGSPIPENLCGPGLMCHQYEDEHPYCVQQMGSECLNQRMEFDVSEGIGHLMERPTCNDDGEFNSIKCIPGQICYCIDSDGNRIFGEALYTNNIEFLMKCECSRKAILFKDYMKISSSNSFIQCDEKGSYAKLQCLGDNCLCVDEITGSPTTPVYNISDIEILSNHNKTGIWNCYTIDDTILLRPCEDEKQIMLEDSSSPLTQSELENMCDFDGTYARVQKNSTHYYCSDPARDRIGNYGIRIEDDLANEINCNCARVQWLLMKQNRIELPQCDFMGNYKRINCRRGYCYCVDVNGHQITEEVPRMYVSRLNGCGASFTTTYPTEPTLVTETTLL